MLLRMTFGKGEEGAHKVSLIRDEDGKLVMPSVDIPLRWPCRMTRFSSRAISSSYIQQLKFEKPGLYAIDIAMDGRQEGSHSAVGKHMPSKQQQQHSQRETTDPANLKSEIRNSKSETSSNDPKGKIQNIEMLLLLRFLELLDLNFVLDFGFRIPNFPPTMAFADCPNNRCGAVLQRSLERGRLGHAYLFSGTIFRNWKRLRARSPRRSIAEPPAPLARRHAGG